MPLPQKPRLTWIDVVAFLIVWAIFFLVFGLVGEGCGPADRLEPRGFFQPQRIALVAPGNVGGPRVELEQLVVELPNWPDYWRSSYRPRRLILDALATQLRAFESDERVRVPPCLVVVSREPIPIAQPVDLHPSPFAFFATGRWLPPDPPQIRWQRDELALWEGDVDFEVPAALDFFAHVTFKLASHSDPRWPRWWARAAQLRAQLGGRP